MEENPKGWAFINTLTLHDLANQSHEAGKRLHDLRANGPPAQTQLVMDDLEYVAQKLMDALRRVPNVSDTLLGSVVEMLALVFFWAWDRNRAMELARSPVALLQSAMPEGVPALQMRDWAVQMLGRSFAETLQTDPFVQFDLRDYDPPMLITIQRSGADSPVEVLNKAIADAARLRAELAVKQATINDLISGNDDLRTHNDSLTVANERLRDELKDSVQPNSITGGFMEKPQPQPKPRTWFGWMLGRNKMPGGD